MLLIVPLDARYWDALKVKRQSTMIIRMKNNLKFGLTEQGVVTKNEVNQGVVTDHIIALESSTRLWRLIDFIAPNGKRYQHLTHDVDFGAGCYRLSLSSALGH